VGDHLHDDIAGAAAVGMHTIWINPDRTIEPDQGISPSHTVHTIVDVPDGIIQIARSLPGPS
jgi:FMN phosphatase YigB (HAD superfamily)